MSKSTGGEGETDRWGLRDMTAHRLVDLLPHICHQEWRPFPRWRGRYRALFRSLRNSGHIDAHTSAVIRTGKEYARWLEART